jgi:hypothetical protein
LLHYLFSLFYVMLVTERPVEGRRRKGEKMRYLTAYAKKKVQEVAQKATRRGSPKKSDAERAENIRYLTAYAKKKVQEVAQMRAEEQSQAELDRAVHLARSRKVLEQNLAQEERARRHRSPPPTGPMGGIGGLLDLPGGEQFGKTPAEVAAAQQRREDIKGMEGGD